MAALTKAPPRIIYRGDAETKRVRVADNQSWNPNEFLRIDSAGTLKACATGADVAAGGGRYLSGKVQADPDNATTFATVTKIENNTIFEGNLHHDTVASATATAARVGQQYALDVTSNVHAVDLEDQSNLFCEVTEIASDYNEAENLTTDTNGRVRFKVLQTVIEAAPQS